MQKCPAPHHVVRQAYPWNVIDEARAIENSRALKSLEWWLEQVTVSGRGHPTCARKMTVMHATRAIGLAHRINTENHGHDLAPVGALLLRIEQADVGFEGAARRRE